MNSLPSFAKYIFKFFTRKIIFYIDAYFEKLRDIVLQKDFSGRIPSIRYQPSKTYEVRKILNEINTKDKIFLDVGSGKGLILFLTAKFNFSKIYGVEINADLFRISTKNLSDFKDDRLEVINADIFDLNQNLFDSIDIFYLFNPFSFNDMDKFVATLVESFYRNKRCVDIIYTSSQHDVIFKKYHEIREVKRYSFFVSYSPTQHYQIIV